MLVPTKVYNDVITGFTGNVDAFKHGDLAETVVISVVHLNVPTAIGRSYKVTRQASAAPLVEAITESEVSGKDNSVSGVIFNNGTLWFIVAEAIPAQSGTTTKIDIYEYAGAFAPVAPPAVVSVDQTARNTANQALSLAQAVKASYDKLLAALKSVCNIT